MNKLSIITILLASRKTGCITATRFFICPCNRPRTEKVLKSCNVFSFCVYI